MELLKNTKTITSLIIIISLLFFIWFIWQPAQIRKECAIAITQKEGLSIIQADYFYAFCLRSNGLK